MPTNVISPDADTVNADWTKQSWDFPPYKSPEFFEVIGHDPQHLEDFKRSPAYMKAVERGLIHDDEWVLDWCTPDMQSDDDDDDDPAPPPRKRPRQVHVHIAHTVGQPVKAPRATADLTFKKRRVYGGAHAGEYTQITWSDGHVDRIVLREGHESNGLPGWHDLSANKHVPSASFLAVDEDDAIEVLHQRRLHPGVK